MTCFLISTFDRCQKLARRTLGRIEREWANHPPVFFAGLAMSFREWPRGIAEMRWPGVFRQMLTWSSTR